MDVASSYVNENTVSCRLENPKQVHLCYGQVSMLNTTDLKSAANTLQEQLSFITVDQAVKEEAIPFAQEQREDAERYEDLPPVVTEGEEGLKQVITETTYRNGEQQEETTTEQVVREPVNEVTTVGTKPRYEYIWPVDGRISSGFGIRHIKVGSRNHKGIDIAVPKGTDILASKSGVVSFAGRNGGYGNLVKIDHGDGTETYYGHNSQLLVQKGDYVEQGDLIAYAGSTGRSTGPHCHFEIRIDGKAVNPIEYLPEK
jgi:murein DD-endopeptidase MepM/ murein hydrolase activator NlpD